MLGKLFKRKTVPNNDGGRESATPVPKLHYTKVFELELSNMEGSPVYALTHQLSIGREIGNIIIADPSVSPRHASFIVQQEVVSVIDHGSVAGTLVNGKKIPAGKYIILEETDLVQIGDLEVRLKTSIKTEAAEEIPDFSPEEIEEVEELVETPDIPEVPSEDIEEDERPVQVKRPSKPKSSSLKLLGEDKSAANSIVRLVAVLADLLLAYSLLVVLMPFDEFKSFLELIPNLAKELIGMEWGSWLEQLEKENSFLATMLSDLYSFFTSTFQIGPLVLMFLVCRLISTLIFGVSFSEFVLGVRAAGNPLWSRIGGAFRVLLGSITGPLLIFDIPAIISRRTFKEVLTFTRIYIGSRLAVILGTLVFLPLMLCLAILSPLMEGLEPPEPIAINDRIEQRVKVKSTETVSDQTTAQVIEVKSNNLNLHLAYDSNELSVIPHFKFQGMKSKLNLKNGLIFYQRDLQRQVEVDVFKTFDMRQLLGMGMRGNVPLYDKYPQIYNFVYESLESHPAFKSVDDVTAQSAFANEVMAFSKTAFSLSLDNAFEVMQSETFLIKGLIDYRSAFLGLIEYKDFDEINFLKIGNTYFMKIGYKGQKPFDLIIPLIKSEGKILRVSYDKKENLQSVSSKFYKYNLDKSDWLSLEEVKPQEVMTAFEVFDLFSTADFKKQLLVDEKAQSLYAFYFETSARMLKSGDPIELEIWKNKTKSLLKLLETIPAKAEEEEGLLLNKLQQNFRDLVDALDNNNTEYFNVETTQTV